MKKVMGIDLGTNSIGWTIREINSTDNQIVDKGVLTFEKGVGEDQGKEVPLVQKRTESRSKRRNYQARKYRKWELLETLILNEPRLCPLSIEELNGWRNYEKGRERIYPQSEPFINWLRLDFDGDGKSDYINPYELRKEASEKKLDDAYALGRVFYHMVQRRGFRGRDEEESKTILEGSKEKETVGASEIQTIMAEENTTLGGALFLVREKYNKRIRNRYNLRTDVEAELKTICKVQGIDENGELFRKLYKSIIWQRPLRTQKGNVGRCIFEPSKPRCPVSHPLYEEYRMWSFINNIRVNSKRATDNESVPLNNEQKTIILQNVFFGKKKNKDGFEFSEIVKALDKKGDTLEFNYKPFTTVSGCPVTFLLKEIFNCELSEIKIPHKPNEKRKIKKDYYNYNDLWQALFTFDSKEKLETFAKEKLYLDDEKAKAFSKIRMPKGYASLSLNVISKILPYLRKGFIYSEAVFLANLPKVFGRQLNDAEVNKIAEGIRLQKKLHKRIREELSIVNSLIGDYLNKPFEEQTGRYPDYILINKDKGEIEKKIIEYLGNKKWNELDSEGKSEIKQSVEKKYQEFLQTPKNTEMKLLYHKPPRLADLIKDYLRNEWKIEEANLKYLYHPSETDLYPPSKEKEGKKYLGDPVPISRGFKNPMALKTLHHLKHLINYLIMKGKIDEETRVVVEIARELNDANKRKAIERWQRDREKQNQEFAKAIKEFAEQENITIEIKDELIDKYRLWTEQERQCIYTGKIISLTELFDGTKFDFEHTIPADISFDNELKNLTIADSFYNRQIKQKKIPSELSNYESDVKIDGIIYTVIKPRLKFMEEKVEHFKKQVEFWKKEAKKAQTKDRKDQCIQNRHYNQFELDYWLKKLDTFTMKEYKPQWRNSQLRDTQIITKYALHYLKTVFDKVEVQKGNVVAEFRKIFNVGFEKERSKHTHHAIDAAVLTLIPPPTIRDRLLKEHFAAMENNIRFHSKPIDWDNFIPSTILEIENDTLVNYIAQDRTLVPTKKNVRKRGRIQYVKEKLENGKWQYKLDENGNRIPLIAKGDSIRGQLHKETFYGAIKENSNEDLTFVVKKSVKDFKSEKEFEDIIDPIVRKVISETVADRIKDGKSFKEAIAEPIWMIDNNGNPKKTDKNGDTLLPIRHIRCRARAGRGYFTKALQLKEHIFKSEQEHKQWYYVQNEINYLFLLYENETDGKVSRTYDIINLLDLVKIGIKDTNELYQLSLFQKKEKGKGKKKTIYKLKQILKVGQRVLLWKENPDELRDLAKKELLNRLYKIYKFNEISKTAYVYLKHHNEARPDLELPEGDKYLNLEKYQPVITLTSDKLNCLFEGIDFEIKIDGEIIMKR
jgi:CRISPR-associated endonuclease Csn1